MNEIEEFILENIENCTTFSGLKYIHSKKSIGLVVTEKNKFSLQFKTLLDEFRNIKCIYHVINIYSDKTSIESIVDLSAIQFNTKTIEHDGLIYHQLKLLII